MSETLVKVENISKKFCRDLKRSLWYGMKDLGNELFCLSHNDDGQLRKDEFWALKNVSFVLKRGECLGLIGRNGAGKTTLLRMLNGLIKPEFGRIEMRGRVGALIALGAGFNPILTGRENIYVNAAVLGLSKKETDGKFEEIVEFAELGEFIDTPVQHYSSGMFVRLGFSVAASFEPDILLVDEALAVGDLSFMIRCLNRIAELRKNGTAVLFVSHNELQVREAAQSCILIDQGHATLYDSPERAFLVYGSLRLTSNLSHEENAGFVHKGPIQITTITVNSNNGSILPITSDEIIFELVCEAQIPCLSAELELRFWNNFGQLVSSVRSVASGLKFDLPLGKSCIRVEIASQPLAPGRYRVAGGFRRKGEVLGWSWDLTYLDIAPPNDCWSGEGVAVMRSSFYGPKKL